LQGVPNINPRGYVGAVLYSSPQKADKTFGELFLYPNNQMYLMRDELKTLQDAGIDSNNGDIVRIKQNMIDWRDSVLKNPIGIDYNSGQKIFACVTETSIGENYYLVVDLMRGSSEASGVVCHA
jgi:hypothetical protein